MQRKTGRAVVATAAVVHVPPSGEVAVATAAAVVVATVVAVAVATAAEVAAATDSARPQNPKAAVGTSAPKSAVSNSRRGDTRTLGRGDKFFLAFPLIRVSASPVSASPSNYWIKSRISAFTSPGRSCTIE